MIVALVTKPEYFECTAPAKIPLYFRNTSLLKFNFCSQEDYSIFSKEKNDPQFYMRIAFKLNRTKKKVHHKFEIAFNFKKEIPLKCFLSPLGDTLSPLGIVPFYTRIPFKIHLEQKKSSPKY